MRRQLTIWQKVKRTPWWFQSIVGGICLIPVVFVWMLWCIFMEILYSFKYEGQKVTVQGQQYVITNAWIDPISRKRWFKLQGPNSYPLDWPAPELEQQLPP